jgi:hypothetical protein
MTTGMTSQPAPTRTEAVSLVVTALGLGVVVLLVAPLLRTPAHVDRITIDNPHPWPANVEVSAPGDDGWLGVGAVDQQDENGFDAVVDQGDRWIFRFSYAGEHTELHVTQRQLERGDWHVTVPDELARRLRDADQPEAPTS